MAIGFYFDLVPVVIAIYALYRLNFIRRTAIIWLSKLAAILLIVCQTTWIHAYLNEFSIVNTVIDHLWTVFNTIVMIILVLISKKEDHHNDRRRSKI